MYEYSIKKIRHENIKVLNTEIKDKLGTYLTYLGHIINAIFSILKVIFHMIYPMESDEGRPGLLF